MAEYKIRKLTKKDFELFKKVFSETLLKEMSEYPQKTRNYFVSEKYIKRMFRLKIKLGAFAKEKLVGYFLAYCPTGGGVIEIFWLAILRGHQKKGIGTRLLQEVENKALKLGVHNIRLEADKRNIQYYVSRGYSVIGLDKKGYFGTDNYIMTKIIQEPKEENFLK